MAADAASVARCGARKRSPYGDPARPLLRCTDAPDRDAAPIGSAHACRRAGSGRIADRRVQRAPDVAKRERTVSVVDDIALRPVQRTGRASGEPDARGVRGAEVRTSGPLTSMRRNPGYTCETSPR